MKNARPQKAGTSAVDKRKNNATPLLRRKVAGTMLASYENQDCDDFETTRDLAEDCYRVADYMMGCWGQLLENDQFVSHVLDALSYYAKRYWNASFTTGMLAEACSDMATEMLLAGGDLHDM